MKKMKLLVLTVAFTFLAVTQSFAVGKNHHDGGRVPIDGGIGLLLLAGAGLAAKRIMDKKKQKRTPLL